MSYTRPRPIRLRAKIKGGAIRSKAQMRAVSYARVRRFRSGYDRTGGFYGRYRGGDRELKFLDTSVANAVAAAAGTIANSNLVLIPQGDGPSDREGRKVTVTKINMRCRTNLVPAAAANGYDSSRVIVYLDKQCNGAAPAVTDILAAATYLKFNNLANSKRFVILTDKHITLDANAGVTTAYNNNSMLWKWNKTCNIPIEYDNTATTGAIATIRSNILGILTISENALMFHQFEVRVRFYG